MELTRKELLGICALEMLRLDGRFAQLLSDEERQVLAEEFNLLPIFQANNSIEVFQSIVKEFIEIKEEKESCDGYLGIEEDGDES